MPKKVADRLNRCLSRLGSPSIPERKPATKNPKNLRSQKKSSSEFLPKTKTFKSTKQLRRIFWENPLNADQVSRCMGKNLSLLVLTKPPPPARSYDFWGSKSSDRYKITLKISKELFKSYQKGEIKELLRVMRKLNSFAKVPMRTFLWDKVLSASYDETTHRVHLKRYSRDFKIPTIKQTMSELVHEMGHGLYYKGFIEDEDWVNIFDLSLGYQNYEIIDDSNYQIGYPDMVGHPYSNPNEAFASAVHAFFLHGDRFAHFIQSPKTPRPIRDFGKLVWTYLRDRVFHGEVFTGDGKDPLARESLNVLIEDSKEGRIRDLISALSDADPQVQKSVADAFGRVGMDAWDPLIDQLENKEPTIRAGAARSLGQLGPGATSTLLKIMKDKDEDFSVRKAAAEGLAYIGSPAIKELLSTLKSTDPKSRTLASFALGKIAPDAKAAFPALIRSLSLTPSYFP